ncbi:MAG TPA: FAD-dependent oxidoreductase [Candidatus Dormibacteraeota bacterium]|nr:FAD-dependent oxidoreductase [Candidatus Dormibacteraeota bacterium]
MPEVTVYGAPWCPDCKRSKQFLSQHRVAFDWVDVDQDQQGLQLVEKLQQGGRTIPTIVFGNGDFLLEPTDEELASKLGLSLKADRGFYDVAIVGGGPAGLAAAIYAAREGMDAIVLDRSALGGQSGVTERIDNYPGFPEGIEGAKLAERFIAQARRYLVELLPAVSVAGIAAETDDLVLRLGTGQEVAAHAIILATGSSYRRLGVPGEDGLIGAGVHFCATCDGPFYKGAKELMVIGGGNSALEEGLFLTQFAKRIRVLQRGPELTASRLLQDKVLNHPQFVIHTDTEVLELQGQSRLEGVVAKNTRNGEEFHWNPAAAFVFIGLDPNTEFVKDTVALDDRGFIQADATFQTSLPGVFAAGDVREGSTKQLGSAVGDGIAALRAVRRYLQEHHHMAEIR